MAGGTGGHVMPALAVARELKDKGIDVNWVGTAQGLESRVVPESNIVFDAVDIKGLRGNGWLRKLVIPFLMLKAMAQTLLLIKKYKPKAVLGMGGFVSGPGGLTASILKLPVLLHEQNSVAGMTNRWLARLSKRVLTGFPSVAGLDKSIWVGNPIKREIVNIPPPEERLASRTGPLRILVIGGSQGASVFNTEFPELVCNHPVPELDVWHQSGRQGRNGIGAAYLQAGIGSQVNEFIDDMARAYEWCDVIICRSGAMTVAEVCGAGAVAIFVPYPYAVSDHQAENANYLVKEDAAIMIRQEQFIQGEWLDILTKFHSDRSILVTMANAARKLSKPKAAQAVAEICIEAMDA